MLHKISVWTDSMTLLAASWRAAVAILDWRTHLRRLTRKPVVDVIKEPVEDDLGAGDRRKKNRRMRMKFFMLKRRI